MAPAGGLGVASVVGPVGLLVVLLVGGCVAEEPPRFIKEPKDQIGVSGGVASFVCQATGDPKPRVTWNKKGKKVNSQRFETIEFDGSAGAVLRIQPLRTPRDENVYECVAQNAAGEITVHAKLTVLREDQLPPGFPNIDMGPQLKVVERTRTATMLCAASGNPDPEITWFKDFLPVDPSASNGRIKQLRSGALQIESSEETDQGKYECVATNSAGVRYSSPANLYVRGRERRVQVEAGTRPAPSPSPLGLIASGLPRPLQTQAGGPLPGRGRTWAGQCLSPDLGFFAYKWGQLDPSPPLCLVLDTQWAAGLGEGAAGGDGAGLGVGVSLEPAGPGEPAGLGPTPPARVSFFCGVSCVPPPVMCSLRFSEIRGLVALASPPLLQRPPSESRGGVLEADPRCRPLRSQKGLVPPYLSSVIPCLFMPISVSLCLGYVSRHLCVRFCPCLCPFLGPCFSVCPSVFFYFSVSISLSLCHCLSLSLFLCICLSVSLHLSLSLSLPPCPCSQVGRTFDPATAFVVDDLKPNTEYAFRLAARSPQGLGAFTSVVRQRTLQSKPSAPPQDVKCVSTRSTAILVSWRPPPPETHNGALVSYSVRYRPLGSEDPQPKEVNGIPPTTTQILLEALDKWTEYRITTVAHTEVGPGPESSPVVIRTDEDVPSAPPRKVEAEALNATAIRVLWRSPAPGRQHGQIRGYQVHYVRMEGAEARGPPRIKDIMLADAQEMVITNLQPETAYSITVAAYTMKGDGARSKPKVVVTKGAVLGRPTLSVQQTPEGSLLARWEPPASTAEDQVLGYRLQFGREDSSPLATLEFPPTEDRYTASGVHKGATYVFRLATRSRGGLGEEAVEVLSIPEDTPQGHPQILEAAGNASAGTVLLRWLPPVPAERNGAIVKYTVAVREAGTLGPARETELPAAAEPGAENVLTLQGLKPDTAYDLQVRAHTRRGPGPYSPPVRYRTFLRDQVSPKNFKVKMIMKTSVLLSWEFPDNYDSPTPYKIQYNGLTLDVDGRTTKKLITHLKPNTFYNFVLTNRGSSLGGLQQTVTAWTAFNLLSGKPSVAPKPDTDGFILVYLPDGQSPVPVQSYFIVMVPLRKSRGGQFLTPLGSPEDMDLEELTQDVSRLQRRSLRHSRQLEAPRPYIAARFSVLPSTFQPGDQKQYGGFDNRGLEPGHRYVLFVLAALQKSEPTFAASPFSDPFQLDNPDPQPIVDGEEGLIWVIGPVLAVVFIICIVIAILLYKQTDSKRKDSEPRTKCLLNNADLAPHHPKDPVEMRRINFQTPDSGLSSPLREPGFHFESMLSHPPVPIADMAEHTERLKANDSLKLSQEYESIDPGQQFTWEHSNLEVNKPKNRYANVIAYDHSRVILQPIEGVVGSDYINANYVDGYRRQNAYIATQGPLPETFGDFWRMVWEQRSATIVMMTRLEEKSRIKCDQYWPNRGTETYGCIQVTLLDTIELATFCVRTFSLHKNGSSEKREVRQFQFTAWPDHGVPEYPTPFLAFLRRVKTCNPPDAGPVVVHCSAGVGRTGCFIVIDAMLERIKPEKTVDVYGHVTLMRSQRNYMVQTEDQYSFIHEALLEAVGCGNTEVPARSLYAYIQKLAQVEPGEHVAGMELEFKRLANSKAHTSRFISANLPCNKFKNRLVNIMPYESTRVCLQPIRGVEGSDYINASFIDGYRQQKAYIATQGPLAETTEDFWRMLWENNSTIVVMLTKLREMGREKCHQYWPAERSARYQYFVVDPMAEYNMPQYILREFKVTDARDGQSRTVRQFQFTDWPEQGVPKSGEGFIDFIGQVHKTKEQFGQDGPISVHCSAGVGRTGVFITLSIVLERMRYEGVVDIFQTVKMLRTQRPAMVQTEDEYQFCYQAALEYLGSFDHYAT
ncbi:LOW QUALITY PROTEIN: receptor-type tyrosine-protein phosphatase S [Pteropus medius]|uniref:LOW QUALITY PROTEIN: receptor-type tyrosine-protein phosphatase S n=1 Tax=Pteropus vampyrus TaxID=132908 RepID=UPI00196B50F4|nr:LOW QUALITY PROTEIN: receptor-type tyrosine-protein phosphatase S [Pteropus giganteus]